MITWAEIVLLILKIADAILGQVKDQKQFKAGVDSAVAKAAESILRKTAAGKAMMEKVDAMSSEEVDAGLRDLEPR